MQIGVRLPGGREGTRENIERAARWAEALGFASLWLSDHVIMPARVDAAYPYASDHRWPHRPEHPWIDPLVALAWAGAVAPSLQLGTSVIVLPLRHPIHLAKQVASLDFLSGGRVVLGVGAGWMAEEFQLLGVPFEDRGRRSVEMVRLMRRLWTGEPVTFEGRIWRVPFGQMAPAPAQRPVPIVWGGHTEPTYRRIARVGDGWHPLRLSIDEVRAGLARIYALAMEFGRDPTSLTTIVRPGAPLTRAELDDYRAMGIAHIVIDPPVAGAALEGFRDVMEQVAALAGLRPRGSVETG
jgi:probable F420-dependent oxidoreductase